MEDHNSSPIEPYGSWVNKTFSTEPNEALVNNWIFSCGIFRFENKPVCWPGYKPCDRCPTKQCDLAKSFPGQITCKYRRITFQIIIGL